MSTPNPDDYYDMGLQCAERGEHHRAIEYFTQAIQLKPDLDAAYISRASVYNHLGHLDDAIKDCDRAIQLNSTGFAAYVVRGFAYRHRGDYERAIADYGRAIQLQPDSVDTYYNRGVLLYKLGQYEQAIQDFDRAINLRPDDADACSYRSRAYAKLTELDRASQERVMTAEILPPEFVAAASAWWDGKFPGKGAAIIGLLGPFYSPKLPTKALPPVPGLDHKARRCVFWRDTTAVRVVDMEPAVETTLGESLKNSLGSSLLASLGSTGFVGLLANIRSSLLATIENNHAMKLGTGLWPRHWENVASICLYAAGFLISGDTTKDFRPLVELWSLGNFPEGFDNENHLVVWCAGKVAI